MNDLEVKQYKYSKIDMLNRHDYVCEADSYIAFITRWLMNCAGSATLTIRLPKLQRNQLLQICKTVKVISKKSFTLSNLVNYQIVELQRKLELNPNLYSLLRSLKNMDENPAIEKYKDNRSSLVLTKIRLTKRNILNLEAILATIAEQLSKHDYNVERTIELLLLSLCYDMNTKSTQVMYEILSYLGVEKEEISSYLDSRENVF